MLLGFESNNLIHDWGCLLSPDRDTIVYFDIGIAKVADAGHGAKVLNMCLAAIARSDIISW